MSQQDATLDGDEARSRLYDVMRSDESFEEQAERALEIGVEYLGVGNGHVAAVDRESDRWEVAASTDSPDGMVPPGLTLNLGTTYCRRVIEEDDPVVLENVPEQGWETDPAFEAHGLHCYHGTVLRVDGELFGTVCFVDEDPRTEPFTDGEVMFVDLVARLLEHALAERRHETRLAENDRELRKQREWRRSIVEASTDLVFRLDPEGEFTFVSDNAEELLGHAPQELQGESAEAILPEGDPRSRATDAFETVTSGDTVELTDLPLSTADGDRVHVDVHAAPVHAADGSDRIVAHQYIVRDVTERRRRERLVNVLHRLLRHNLRNEMTVVRGLAEEIGEQTTGTAADLAERIVATSDDLVALSEKARTLEETVDEEPTARPVDIAPAVEQAAGAVADAYPAADVSTDIPAEATAMAAPALEAAVRELVENAASHAGEAPTVDVEVAASDDAVAVQVSDDGPGLSAQDRTVLRRGDQSPLHHGSGIGLWLAYWIAESLDAEIDVATSDRGTTVTIALAAAERPSPEMESETESEPAD